MEQISKLEQISKIGTNLKHWNKFQKMEQITNWNKFQNWKFFRKWNNFQNETISKKWNKLQIGTNFKFEIFEFKQIPKSEHIKI
jgi:hypothetical protein